MVHALEKTHRLLKLDGLLIDMRPAVDTPSVEVGSGGQVSRAGRLGHRQNFASYKQAHAALAQVVESGVFVLERESTFPFLYHANTLAALREWLAESWENAILDEETVKQVEELLNIAGDDREVIVRHLIRIVRLKPG